MSKKASKTFTYQKESGLSNKYVKKTRGHALVQTGYAGLWRYDITAKSIQLHNHYYLSKK